MRLNGEKANNDIQTIKETLDRAKSDFNGLHTILLYYGVTQLASMIITLLIVSIFNPSKGSVIYTFLPAIISAIASVFILFIYIKIFRKEKNTSNKYYLSCLAMWGSMAVFLPFIMLAVRIGIYLINSQGYKPDTPVRLYEFEMLINVMLVCFCCIICSFITNKKWLAGTSLLILLTFLVLNISFYSTISNGAFVLNIFYFSITTLGYIALSFMIRKSEHARWT